MSLKAEQRTITGRKVSTLRKAQTIPSVVYGPKFESQNITVDYKEFRAMFKEAGYSKLLDLEIGEQNQKAIVKEIQINPVTREFIHVSFYAVDMNSAIDADIPLELIGEAPAVKNNLGFLEQAVNTLTVHCLPGDLPAKIVVDISKLENIHDGVSISDLDISDKVEVVGHDADFRVAFIAEPQKIEIEEPEAAVVEGAEGDAGTEAAEGDAAANASDDSAKAESK